MLILSLFVTTILVIVSRIVFHRVFLVLIAITFGSRVSEALAIVTKGFAEETTVIRGVIMFLATITEQGIVPTNSVSKGRLGTWWLLYRHVRLLRAGGALISVATGLMVIFVFEVALELYDAQFWNDIRFKIDGEQFVDEGLVVFRQGLG